MPQPSKCTHGIDLDQDCRDCEMESEERHSRRPHVVEAIDDLEDEDENEQDPHWDEEDDSLDDFEDEDEDELDEDDEIKIEHPDTGEQKQ